MQTDVVTDRLYCALVQSGNRRVLGAAEALHYCLLGYGKLGDIKLPGEVVTKVGNVVTLVTEDVDDAMQTHSRVFFQARGNLSLVLLK